MIYLILFIILYVVSFARCFSFLKYRWKRYNTIIGLDDILINICPIINTVISFAFLTMWTNENASINWTNVTIKLFGERND